jgi:acyl-CoA dehydrogenase
MLDMDQPGIKVEPILTMAQDHDFNQVVFTNAIADVKDRIGEENEGWAVAKYLLEFERSGGVGGSKSLSDIKFIKKLVSKMASLLQENDFSSIYSNKINELEIKAKAIQYTSLRILSSLRDGESPGPESSMMKTLVTDLEQEISELTLEVIGYYGIVFQDTTLGTNEPAIGDEDYRAVAGKYQNLRATTIYGGSNEIQRNIMAKAVLGL